MVFISLVDSGLGLVNSWVSKENKVRLYPSKSSSTASISGPSHRSSAICAGWME
jgi:hypothetical protein